MSRKVPGPPPPSLPELVRAEDRLSFVYVERCIVHRDQNAVTATDERGTVHIPAAGLGALLLGPGTNVSHQAMVLLGQSGAMAVWVGSGASAATPTAGRWRSCHDCSRPRRSW